MTEASVTELPTRAEYRKWLVAEGGQFRQHHNDWGGYTELISPDGAGSVCELGIEQPGERLTASALRLLDARLGVQSPWAENSS